MSFSGKPFFSIERLADLLQVEVFAFISFLIAMAWLTYTILLKRLSRSRHESLRRQFKGLLAHLLVGTGFYLLFAYALREPNPGLTHVRLAGLAGFFSVIAWTIVFIKTARILLLEYLFLGHMREGVPLLIVNIFTLILSGWLFGWLFTDLFMIKVGHLLATSALLSVVVGLALQDTLGNLFAGISLQFDKPYELGDWIEVHQSGSKWVGQVHEITWRATLLIAVTEEVITIPNRIMAQSQIANFSSKGRPIIRGQVLRFPYGTDMAEAKRIVLDVLRTVEGVEQAPPPGLYVNEAHESWINARVFYFISDYGRQWAIADEILRKTIATLHSRGIELAHDQIIVHSSSKS